MTRFPPAGWRNRWHSGLTQASVSRSGRFTGFSLSTVGDCLKDFLRPDAPCQPLCDDPRTLPSQLAKLADALEVPGAIDRTGPTRPPVVALREVPDRDGPRDGVATGGCWSLGQTAPQNVTRAVPIEVADALDLPLRGLRE